MRFPWKLLLVVMLGSLPLMVARAQPAEPAAPDPRKAAVEEANRGQALFDDGKYEEAFAAFKKADELFHAPTFTLMMGRAYEKLGRLVAARAIYEKTVQEQLAHYAPRPFFAAQAEAKQALEALVPRIPTVRVLATVPNGQAQLVVDGQAAGLDQDLLLNPGDHTLTVSAPGHVAETRSVTLKEGETLRIPIELTPVPLQAPIKPAVKQPAPRAETRARPPTGLTGRQVGGIALLGGGGILLAVGGVTGIASINETDDLGALCADQKCYDDAGAQYDSAHSLATMSTVTFLLGGAAVAGGIVLVVVGGGSEGTQQQTGLVVRPGWVGVKGAF